jgi:hypothetical protein
LHEVHPRWEGDWAAYPSAQRQNLRDGVYGVESTHNEMVQQAHYSIHHQLVVMETYIKKHLDEIRVANDEQCIEAWV